MYQCTKDNLESPAYRRQEASGCSPQAATRFTAQDGKSPSSSNWITSVRVLCFTLQSQVDYVLLNMLEKIYVLITAKMHTKHEILFPALHNENIDAGYQALSNEASLSCQNRNESLGMSFLFFPLFAKRNRKSSQQNPEHWSEFKRLRLSWLL